MHIPLKKTDGGTTVTSSRRIWEPHFTYQVLKALFPSTPCRIPDFKLWNCQINLLSHAHFEQAKPIGNDGNECF